VEVRDLSEQSIHELLDDLVEGYFESVERWILAHGWAREESHN
jgi:hypothetical protein